MKIGDKIIATKTFGEFESSFEGKVFSFYGKDSIVIKTNAGHTWVFKKTDVRIVK